LMTVVMLARKLIRDNRNASAMGHTAEKAQ